MNNSGVKLTNENQSPYQAIKNQNKWLLIPFVLLIILVLWIIFIAK